jgi:hypothetical protein
MRPEEKSYSSKIDDSGLPSRRCLPQFGLAVKTAGRDFAVFSGGNIVLPFKSLHRLRFMKNRFYEGGLI